jgi:ArsR family transcriptional regulator
MQRAAGRFKLLGDSTRLRLLRVLAKERFNVSELTGILGVAQSGVSRHLGLLRDAGLVTEEREAGYVYYRLATGTPTTREPHGSGEPTAPGAARSFDTVRDVPTNAAGRGESKDQGRGNGDAPLWALLQAEFAASAGERAVRDDEARLQEVLRHRKENFETHGDVRQLVPGRSWAAWARALGHLLPPLDVADIGCGDGYLTLEMARWARTVVGIDRSDQVLERAKALAERRRSVNVEWKKGDLVRLPLHDDSVDVALLSQTLHHAADPEEALSEAVRILRPGGRLLVLDLREHDQQWVRTRFGDQRLGFADVDLERLLYAAGLRDVRVQVGARQMGDPFVVLIASGIKSKDLKSEKSGPKSEQKTPRREPKP